MEDIDYRVVFAVSESWDEIKRIPNYEGVAGELLFRKIFEIAPAALDMYSFGPEFVGREEELYSSPAFKAHSTGVIKMLDDAVNMLGPDLSYLSTPLADLGAKHVGYGVLPAHYGIVGEALLHTLQTALADAWTPMVKKGWTLVYAYLSTAMLAGANRLMDKIERKKARLARKKGESTETPETQISISHSVMTDLEHASSLSPEAHTKLEHLADHLRNDVDGETASQTTSSTDDSDGGDVNYKKMVETVSSSWAIVRKIPNCQEVAGVLLFQNIFEIAPGAKDLFPLAELYKDDDEDLFKDPAFLVHARGVVAMLDACVNMLGPDLEPVTRTLERLGARHIQYGVMEAHYPIVGEALLKTLETALGEKWTPTIKQGWVSIFAFISTTMQNGAKQSSSETLNDQLEL